MYCLKTISAEIFTKNVQQFDDSMDYFLADTPRECKFECYTNALNQIRLGIRDSGLVCYQNLPMVHAAKYSALSDTIAGVRNIVL